jgi:hypothetical protein
LMYGESSSTLSSCPSAARRIPAFRLAETRHFRSASNYDRMHLPDLFRAHSCSSATQQCASLDSPCQSPFVGTYPLLLPRLHFVHCFRMSRS